MTSHGDHPQQSGPAFLIRLTRAFASRDVKARFSVTSLGLLWAVLVPLATVLIYSAVFSVVFRAEAPEMGNGRSGIFAVWFFTGLVTWNMLAQPVAASVNSIVAVGSLMQRIYVPAYVPTVAATGAALLERLFEASVMLAILVTLLNVGWTWLLYPLVVAGVAAMASLVGYLVAVANVYFRDTGQLVGLTLQLLFFLTPVIYPVELVPENWNGIPTRSLLAVNPMAHLVALSREVLYELKLPTMVSVGYVLAWIVGLGITSLLVQRRWGRDISEVV